ncbi:MFS transporter [Sphaerisporangium sp. B11E5]|uniref:MFS transporter n=1 Tax=Sphaerisporangium sp. B11E5 TaxID=3153563 RepID=UPI00325C6918
MKTTAAQIRSFNRPVQLLLVNQLTINIGFYMLMPYLANHLSGDLGLAVWLVGLILGVRNLSQQGMFLIGGSLADRIGYKPMILTGLALRTIGFAMLGLVDSVPMLIVASALTGLAGAFFNPAARAYLAEESGERKVEAFAAFNVFYQMGILIGPLIGLLLQGLAFRVTCLVAAALFAVLAAAQARALPARGGARREAGGTMFGDWRQVVANKGFLLFSLAMIGSYVLNFQIYLGLPIEIRRLTSGELGVTLLFVLSGALAMFGQVHLTEWMRSRWSAQQAIVRGLALMGVSFLPLAITTSLPWNPAVDASPVTYALALTPVLVTTALLTIATMMVHPFEMATIAMFGGDRMVGTYYGFYSTVSGVGIAAGNVLTGAALDAGGDSAQSLPWWGLVALGGACAVGVRALARSGRMNALAAPSVKA